MIDLHMHTFHSDGVLNPAELARRAKVIGYKAMAITDHVDQSNIKTYVPMIVATAQQLTKGLGIIILGGIELTHVPPSQIPSLVKEARLLGAELIIVHGETPVEPVAKGTNLAAIKAGVDILAHPGFITMSEVRLAKKNNVMLELTARGGHSLTNGHVAKLAMQADCPLIVNSDSHTPGDLLTKEKIFSVVCGAGLPVTKIKQCEAQSITLCKRARNKE